MKLRIVVLLFVALAAAPWGKAQTPYVSASDLRERCTPWKLSTASDMATFTKAELANANFCSGYLEAFQDTYEHLLYAPVTGDVLKSGYMYVFDEAKGNVRDILALFRGYLLLHPEKATDNASRVLFAACAEGKILKVVRIADTPARGKR
jgi:hypothetical protein